MKDKLDGLRISIVHDEIIEDLCFSDDKVIATMGQKDGAVCAPVLTYEITGESSLVIDKDRFNIDWKKINIGENTISVIRNGISVDYKITDRPENSNKRRKLP